MKYAVAEVIKILGTEYNKNLRIIEANSAQEAIDIYRSESRHITKYGLKVIAHEANYMED